MERKKEMLSVSFSLSLSIKESESAGFITIIVCLVGILLSVLETGLCRKYLQINVQKQSLRASGSSIRPIGIVMESI